MSEYVIRLTIMANGCAVFVLLQCSESCFESLHDYWSLSNSSPFAA